MRRHVSAEVLALHREGALSPRKARRVTAHVSVCARCAGIDSDLASVSGMLAATALPPMPDAIAERLQLAIASEVSARAGASAAPETAPAVSRADAASSGLTAAGAGAGAGAGAAAPAGAGAEAGGGTAAERQGQMPGRPDLPERARGRSRRFRMPGWSSPLVLRGLAATGAVVVIAGAGLLLANGQTAEESGGGSGGAHGTAGRPAASPLRHRPSPGVTGAKFSHAGRAGVNGPVALNYRVTGKIATARALNSRRDYTRQNMAPLVHKAVASAASIGKQVTGTAQPTPQKGLFGGIRVQALSGCLTRVAAGRTVLVADVARYLGQPATIVVLRPPTDGHVLDVVVVGLTCSAAAPDIVAELTVPAG